MADNFSFTQVDINVFSGLDCNTDPTLIQDYEGSDIVNFRMEKIGKLVSRSGNLPGVIGFVQFSNPERHDFIVKNEGVFGIGELILETKWDEFDTDRFMVYFVRGVTPVSGQQRAAFFFSPLTGIDRNVIVFTEIYDTVDYIDILNTQRTRDLIASEQTVVPDDARKFIDEFVRMNEYRHQLIISDRTNGDMRIVDSFDMAEDPVHSMSLQENCLYNSDIDVVKVDYQLEAGQKNESVENGMALYRYVLPKKTTQVSDDKFVATIGDSAWVGADFTRSREKVRDFMGFTHDMPGSMFYFALFNPKPEYDANFHNLYISWNTTEHYKFTTTNQAEEFPDILGELELNKDKYEDEDGNLQEEFAADVYIWDELTFDYKPCGGLLAGSQMLRDIDRFWSKTTPGIPRITKLNKKTGHGREVPLGIWRYRFVWDFGNGEYSAPTTEMLVGDVLYSVLTDNQITSDNNSVYEREYSFDASEALNADISANTTSYSTPSKYYPEIWDNSGVTLTTGTNFLTATGLALWKVKDALYNTSHRFGGQQTTSALLEAETDASTNDLARQVEGDFGTLCTIFFSKSDVTLSGFASQHCDVSVAVTGNGYNKIIVPIFQSSGNEASYDSIFDDEGRYRAYAGEVDNLGRALVFQGKSQIPMPLEWSSGGSYYFVTNTSSTDFTINYAPPQKDIYFNYIHRQPNTEYVADVSTNLWVEADGVDFNNKPDIAYQEPTTAESRSKQRVNTVIRAVKSEEEKITLTKTSVPTEARRRLILEGVAGIQLIEDGQDYGICSGTEAVGSVIFDADLDYPVKRFYRDMPGQLTYDSGGDWNWANAKFTDVLGQTTDEPVANNLDILIYGDAQRLIALEQLSSYFPASLLFEAPRVRFHIPAENVPPNAKKLIIFRTVSSNRNEFDPLVFGLVDTIEIERADGTQNYNTTYGDAGGSTIPLDLPVFKAEELVDGEDDYVTGVSYFDKVRDSNLDYNDSPEVYEGKRNPIKSAFNLPLNERMYFANYKETVKPPAPRGFRDNYELVEV